MSSDNQKIKNYAGFLKKHFNFRVGKSKYGAGLFAAQDIPKGRKCIAGHPPKTYIPVPKGAQAKYRQVRNVYSVEDDWKKHGVSKTQISMMQDFMCRGSNRKYVPVPNIYDTLYPGLYQFSNHSEKPNVKIEGHYFVALKNIKEGEEILHDYRKICSKNEIIF